VSESAYSPYQRQKTRYRGVMYREKADGSRSYMVYIDGRYVAAGSTEREALEKQAELRGKVARGERAVVPTKQTFAEVAESWFESKAPRLRTSTRTDYRARLDGVLLPRLGRVKIAALSVDDISRLVRDLERDGLHAVDPTRPKRPLSSAAIQNVLKPLAGVMQFAVRRGLVATNPLTLMTADDRPTAKPKARPHEWQDAEVEALLKASRELAAERDAKYDYSTLLSTAVTTGMRLGELLGLEWGDVDFESGRISVRRAWTK
jgi:integrase